MQPAVQPAGPPPPQPQTQSQPLQSVAQSGQQAQQNPAGQGPAGTPIPPPPKISSQQNPANSAPKTPSERIEKVNNIMDLEMNKIIKNADNLLLKSHGDYLKAGGLNKMNGQQGGGTPEEDAAEAAAKAVEGDQTTASEEDQTTSSEGDQPPASEENQPPASEGDQPPASEGDQPTVDQPTENPATQQSPTTQQSPGKEPNEGDLAVESLQNMENAARLLTPPETTVEAPPAEPNVSDTTPTIEMAPEPVQEETAQGGAKSRKNKKRYTKNKKNKNKHKKGTKKNGKKSTRRKSKKN